MTKRGVGRLSGRWAEGVAADYLADKGLEIRARNWRRSYFEIDIVCMDGDVLVFVEVKSRSNLAWGMPFRGLDRRKQKSILAGASLYLESGPYEGPVRFDLVEVVAPDNMTPRIRHFKDVFFPQ